MPESQGHGKSWEKDLGMNVYKAKQEELDSISYTAPIDVPHEFNRLDGIDVSIKVSGKDTIDMADVLRVFDEVSRDKKIHMTVIKWTQNSPTTKMLTNITEVDLTNSRNILFGTVTREQLVELVELSKSVGKVRPDVTAEQRASKIAAAYKMRDELHRITGIMHFHLMFYTNNPSRVQGQFTEFSKFVENNPTRVIAESKTGEFRGGRIAEEIPSSKRIRHKRQSLDLTPDLPLS
jgi:hypothetical protein